MKETAKQIQDIIILFYSYNIYDTSERAMCAAQISLVLA